PRLTSHRGGASVCGVLRPGPRLSRRIDRKAAAASRGPRALGEFLLTRAAGEPAAVPGHSRLFGTIARRAAPRREVAHPDPWPGARALLPALAITAGRRSARFKRHFGIELR